MGRVEEAAEKEANKKGLTGEARERYIGASINHAKTHIWYRPIRKPKVEHFLPAPEPKRKPEKQQSWIEKFANKNIPEDADERRKWYARQWEEAPHKLEVKRTDGTTYRLPFATKGEAEKSMKDAGTSEYRAWLDGQEYERTKNYGWKKK